MKTLKVYEKTNSPGDPITYGNIMLIDADKLRMLIGGTKSLYVRAGRWLSQRGHGTGGAGDICSLDCESEIQVKSNLYYRIRILAKKAGAIIEL